MNTEVEKNLDEIMKKYDKESNVRVFDGKLRWVVLILLAAFSVFGISFLDYHFCCPIFFPLWF